MMQQKRIRLGIRSLVSLSGLRTWHCCELWCRSQKQLGSGVAVAVAYASSCSSDKTPSLGTSICCAMGAALKRQKKKEKLYVFNTSNKYQPECLLYFEFRSLP